MRKCDFCQQTHEIQHLCDCKIAINHLFWAGHLEAYQQLPSGNWSYILSRISPYEDKRKHKELCKFAVKKIANENAKDIISVYVPYGLSYGWFRQNQLDNPSYQLHQYHKKIDQQWK